MSKSPSSRIGRRSTIALNEPGTLTVHLPELTPEEQALLAQFRSRQSPDAAAEARVRARLDAAIDSRPAAPRPWHRPLLIAGATVAMAAAILLFVRVATTLWIETPDRDPNEAQDALTTHQTHGDATPSGQRAHRPQAPSPGDPNTSKESIPVPGGATPPTSDGTTPTRPQAISTQLSSRTTTSTNPTTQPRRHHEGLRTTSAQAQPGPTEPPAADVAEEVRLVARIRQAAGTAKANELIADYRHRFPSGLLREEVDIVALQTRCAFGDIETAARLGKEFLRTHPQSAYARLAVEPCAEVQP